jgi:hypothetical protein
MGSNLTIAAIIREAEAGCMRRSRTNPSRPPEPDTGPAGRLISMTFD